MKHTNIRRGPAYNPRPMLSADLRPSLRIPIRIRAVKFPPLKALLRELRVRALAFIGALLLGAPAHAQMTVEITGVGSQQFPIAVANFLADAPVSEDIASVVRADLIRSGLFRIVDSGSAPIDERARVDFVQWKSRGADSLAVGSVTRLADGRTEVRYRLYDSVKGAQLDGLAFVGTGAELRRIAHKIADRIYEALTGVKGVFSTRIAYVVQYSPNHYELQVADADGANPQVALKSREFIISPAWSPDGTALAYVSFETHKALVYYQNLVTGQRRVLANFAGSNSGPAFAPDGKTMAVVLTRDGNSEIYTMSVDGSGLRRLTFDPAIDTEPVYSPDGAWIYFTSDRSGGPQIYRMPAAGGEPQRITFNGDYNITPRVSPDGKTLAYVSRRSDLFQVEVLDLASAQELTITDTVKDESPTFAPNGRLILYATEVGGRGILALASTDGRARARLSGPNGDVREPTWGPFAK
ncbi:MAG TPA: Tol-Pal system beta propeller repeat protein TolB [Burkholderiaceae bacterium]|nr:Tol-Pal system beta propeller repeat protein TolB [Burkholderiaceae bacterium]